MYGYYPSVLPEAGGIRNKVGFSIITNNFTGPTEGKTGYFYFDVITENMNLFNNIRIQIKLRE